MKFKFGVSRLPVSGSMRFPDGADPPKQANWQYDPNGTQVGILLSQILAYFKLFQMWTDGFPFKGTAWPAPFPTSNLLPGQQGNEVGGKEEGRGKN